VYKLADAANIFEYFMGFVVIVFRFNFDIFYESPLFQVDVWFYSQKNRGWFLMLIG
jgi:hypothetical protein